MFETLKEALNPGIEVIEMDQHINDRVFARKAAELMIQMMAERRGAGTTKP